MKRLIAKREYKKGYTIVELTLSMAFIGVLLVTIATIVVNIISIYQKGLSIRAVNTTGRELVSELSRAIEAAPVKSIPSLCNTLSTSSAQARCNTDSGQLFIFQENHSTRTLNLTNDTSLDGSSTVKNPPTHGAFCTGRYSYVWNTGYVLNDSYGLASERAIATYTYNGTQLTIKDFRLLQIDDQERAVCSNNIDTNYALKTNNNYNLGTLMPTQISADFLDISEDNLAIYDFQVFVPTQHHITAHSFYSGTFILATLQGNVNITAAGNYCNTIPSNLNTDFAYCAINKFNFAAQATGELNESEQRQQRGN